MVLERRSSDGHNAMLGRLMRGAKSSHTTYSNGKERLAKRIKREDATDSDVTSKTEVGIGQFPDSVGESLEGCPEPEPGGFLEEAQHGGTQSTTDLESALPPVKTDKEAIEEYEAFRASQEESAEGTDATERLSKRKWIKGKSSIYVDAFNLALDTVLEDEAHLFNEAEMAVFEQWRDLPYEAQYLYVRLFLRKTSAWHRIRNLGYHSDIADIEGAIEILQSERRLPASVAAEQSNPGELEPPEGTTLGEFFTFADRSENDITTVAEASSLLRLDELKVFAKEAKVQGKNKRELLKALKSASNTQTGLGWLALRRSDTESSIVSEGSAPTEDYRESTPQETDGPGMSRDVHYLKKIMAETGPCIRLSLPTLKLFERVHLVFYRSTEWTEKSLTAIILARISRRNFPEYIVCRSTNIFPSRSLLLEFESSLRTQFRIDSILEFNGKPTEEGHDLVLDIFEQVLPRWRVLLREEQDKEHSIYLSGEGAYLRRLSPGWVYTRIVHKATTVLGKRKQHLREHALLTQLLVQSLFHPARRGAWYQRKALLEEHYMHALTPSDGRSPEAQIKHWKRIALCTCEEALQDNLLHLCYHYDLQKRLAKLERALKVPRRQQHSFAHVRLAAPVEVTVKGIRIERNGPARPQHLRRQNSAPAEHSPSRRGTRTVWLDPAYGTDSTIECTVEEMVLSHYRAAGWKGYHSEGGILRTLFALLFYDILFAYVPHVFQTAFQTCPLDLHSDGFYPARAAAIEHRIVELANGGASRIMREVWDAHADQRTCVVGLDWSFGFEDLVEMVECFDGSALGTVCKVLAQDYGQRGGGVPDLILWNKERKEVKFVEVKSENDRLSDTQRLWVHVLTGAGIAVELCNAIAKEVRTVD